MLTEGQLRTGGVTVKGQKTRFILFVRRLLHLSDGDEPCRDYARNEDGIRNYNRAPVNPRLESADKKETGAIKAPVS